MKKLIFFLMSAVLTAQLCGCLQITDKGGSMSHAPQETTQTAAPENTAPGQTTVPQETQNTVQQSPTIAISLPAVTEEVRTADGTLLFSHTYQNPVFQFDDTAVAQAVLVDLLNQIDSANTDVTRLQDSAEEDYADTAATWYPYFVNVTYNVTRIDQNALSLLGSHVVFEGGIHPSYSPKSVTYDLVTGNRLALQDILADDYDTDTLCALVLDALAPMADDLYGDYVRIITDQFSGSWLDNDDWYLSENGLCFYFAPYDIAPFASGTIVGEIPYEKLTNILLDAYFPPEAVSTNGTVSAALFNQSDAGRFRRFSELILEPEGEKVLLYTDDLVTDIRISQGVWNEEGTEFYADSIVFAANCMTGEEAILLQAFIPDTMPDLRLQYTSADKRITVYLSQSGKDGSIILME